MVQCSATSGLSYISDLVVFVLSEEKSLQNSSVNKCSC